MIFAGRTKRPTREELEAEAADILAARIAMGRPPPDVWRQAEEWRAAHPVADDGWYTADDPASRRPPAVGAGDLELRVVRLPLAGAGAAGPIEYAPRRETAKRG